MRAQKLFCPLENWHRAEISRTETFLTMNEQFFLLTTYFLGGIFSIRSSFSSVLKANIQIRFFLTFRHGSERFLLFSGNFFEMWMVHLFTCAEQYWSKQFKKKVDFGFNPTFFWTVWQDIFKSCKQTRCQRNILFYLNFFCFCSIMFYSYAIVLFLLYFVETVPIRFVSNGYCVLDLNRTVHWIEPLKKP